MKKLLMPIRKRIYLISAIIILLLSLLFSYLMIQSMNYHSFNTQTLVGSIYLDNIEESQYANHITSEVEDWKNKSTYKIIYQNISLEVNLDYFNLDISQTIDDIRIGENNLLAFEFSNQSEIQLINEMENVFSENIINQMIDQSFFNTLLSDLETMNVLKTYRLEDFLEDDLSSTVIDTITINNINAEDVNHITSIISQISIYEKSRFSILDSLSNEALSNEQLSIIASGIQKVTMLTPFNGYIFNQYKDAPSWSEDGLNVRILKTNQFDFSFYNPLDFNYTIQINKSSDTSISLSLIGYPFINQYTIQSNEEVQLDYQTIYIENTTIDETTENIIIIDDVDEVTYHLLIQSGVNGKILSWERTVIYPDLSESTSIIYREIINPIPEIYQENIVQKEGE